MIQLKILVRFEEKKQSVWLAEYTSSGPLEKQTLKQG